MPAAVAWPVLAILVFVNAINFKGLFKGGVREQRVDCKREEKNVNTVLRIHKCIKDLLWLVLEKEVCGRLRERWSKETEMFSIAIMTIPK